MMSIGFGVDSGNGLLYSTQKGVAVPKPSKHVVLSMKEIGNRLRALRQARDMTQAELARALGTQQTAISQVELGNRGLTVQQVVKLAKALRVSTDAVLGPSNGSQDEALPRDRKLISRLRQIERLPRAEKQALLRTIDAFLKSSQVA
jgi:transcriptional regulator with XRE-family HTH domain